MPINRLQICNILHRIIGGDFTDTDELLSSCTTNLCYTQFLQCLLAMTVV